MSDATPEKMTLSELNKSKASKVMERAVTNGDRSPPNKRKPPGQPPAVEPADPFEATTSGASREIGALLSKMAEVFSERAAADTCQVKELEGVLTEARSLESHLQEKKNHLKQTLALISDKLQV